MPRREPLCLGRCGSPPPPLPRPLPRAVPPGVARRAPIDRDAALVAAEGAAVGARLAERESEAGHASPLEVAVAVGDAEAAAVAVLEEQADGGLLLCDRLEAEARRRRLPTGEIRPGREVAAERSWTVEGAAAADEAAAVGVAATV